MSMTNSVIHESIISNQPNEYLTQLTFYAKRTKLPNLPLVQVGEDKIVHSEVVKNLGCLLMDSNVIGMLK